MNCTGKRCVMQFDKVDPATCKCVSYCPQATPPETNADRIRSMTDEQLSEWIADWFDCSNCSEFFGGMPCSQRECADVWLGWLKREVSDEVR